MNKNQANVNKPKNSNIHIQQEIHYHRPEELIEQAYGNFEEAKNITMNTLDAFAKTHPYFPHMRYGITFNGMNQQRVYHEPATKIGKDNYKLKGKVKFPKKPGIENLNDIILDLSITGDLVEVEGELNEFFGEKALENLNKNEDYKIMIEAVDKIEPFPVKFSGFYDKASEITLVDYTKIKWEQLRDGNGYAVASNSLDDNCPFTITYYVPFEEESNRGPVVNFKIREKYQDNVKVKLDLLRYRQLHHFSNSKLRMKRLDREQYTDLFFHQYNKYSNNDKEELEALISVYENLETIETHYNLNFSLPPIVEFDTETLEKITALYNAINSKYTEINEKQIEVIYSYDTKEKGLVAIKSIECHGNNKYELVIYSSYNYEIELFNEKILFRGAKFIGTRVYLDDVDKEKRKIQAFEDERDSRKLLLNFENMAVLYLSPIRKSV